MRRLLLTMLPMTLCTCAATPSRPAPSADPAVDASRDRQKFEGTLELVRRRNALDYAVSSPNKIDEAKYVEIGGIQQWVTIRGENRNNPALLFLHGGPGDATNPWGYAVFRPWLEHFTIVQWDQRGAGRTLGKNGATSAAAVSVDRMVQDGVEIATWVTRTLNKDKIVLVGHSWGSILGVLMAKARPSLFYAFVGTGQVADPAKSYAVAYAELVQKADALKNERATRDLASVGPPPYRDGKGYAVQRRWANFFEGADILISSMLGAALTAPGYDQGDVNDWIDGQGLSADRLVPETSTMEAKKLGGDFDIPILVIQGAEDFTTPTRLARAYVDSIRAPAKAFIALEGGGHFAVFTKGPIFVQKLSTWIAPYLPRSTW